MTSYAKQRASVPALRRIGVWATWWWALSGAYMLASVWVAKDLYRWHTGGGFSWHVWWFSYGEAFSDTAWLQLLLGIVAAGWLVGGGLWLRALQQHKISYRTALKDLFFTIRK
jgi:hypothetical protein